METYADACKASGRLEQFDMENIQHRYLIHDMAMVFLNETDSIQIAIFYVLRTSPKASSPKDS